MFWWIVGGIVLYAFVMLLVCGLCKAASDADDWTERWYAEEQKKKLDPLKCVECGEEYKWN